MRFLSVVLFFSACETRSATSEQGQFHITVDDVVTDVVGGVSSRGPVLVGTALCGEPRAQAGSLAACFEPGAAGAASLNDEGCLVIDGPGEAAWTFTAQTCAVPTPDGSPWIDDEVVFTGVSLSSVTASLDHWPERLITEAEQAAPETVDGEVPTDWVPAPGEPLQVVEGAAFTLPLALRHADFEDAVAWDPAAMTVRVGDQELEPVAPGRFAFGEHAGPLTAEIDGQSFALGQIELVPSSAVASLELVTSNVDNDTTSQPLAARAIARDADGALVFGAPIAWDLARGQVALEPGGTLPGEDYTWVRDACEDGAVGKRGATVRARLGELTATAAMRWDLGDEAISLSTGPDPMCEASCGCTSASRSPAALGWIAAAVALLRRRRDA